MFGRFTPTLFLIWYLFCRPSATIRSPPKSKHLTYWSCEVSILIYLLFFFFNSIFYSKKKWKFKKHFYNTHIYFCMVFLLVIRFTHRYRHHHPRLALDLYHLGHCLRSPLDKGSKILSQYLVSSGEPERWRENKLFIKTHTHKTKNMDV